MKTSTPAVIARRSLIAVCLTTMAAGIWAQTAKSIVPEQVPAFPAFTQWISAFTIAQPEPTIGRIESIPLVLMGTSAQAAYQPMPVILGLPELPLTGNGVAQAARAWGPTLNYQGMHLRQVVLNESASLHELRPMNAPVHAGERFKIRITATFDAVAEVDQVVGDAWYGQRTGQLYPLPGRSVQIRAGETVDLPLGTNEYFLMNRLANERLVLSVRHPQAVAGLRTEQPAYRQDGRGGSSYLQLVPRGKLPAMEQQIGQVR